MTRRDREIQDLRNKIVSQSWKIIMDEGWQSLSIRKIAEAIEYSAPVIYKHFENKEAIIEHFSKEGFLLLSSEIALATISDTDTTLKLKNVAYAYWKFASKHTQHYRIMFGLGIPVCETINSSTEMQAASNHMLQAIENVLLESNNISADKHLKLKTFWSTLHGFIAIELLSNNTIPIEPTATLIDAVNGFIFTLKNNN